LIFSISTYQIYIALFIDVLNYKIVLIVSTLLNIFSFLSIYFFMVKNKYKKKYNNRVYDLIRLSFINISLYVYLILLLGLKIKSVLFIPGMLTMLILLSYYDILDHKLKKISKPVQKLCTSIYFLVNALLFLVTASVSFPEFKNTIFNIGILISIIILFRIIIEARDIANTRSISNGL